MEAIGVFGVILLIFAIIVGILWILVPFLIMGVNKRLDKLNKNLIVIGRLLKERSKNNKMDTSSSRDELDFDIDDEVEKFLDKG